MRTLIMTLACFLAFSVSAEAKHHRTHYKVAEAPLCYPSNNIMIPCGPNPNFLAGVRSIKVHMKQSNSRRERRARVLVNYAPSFSNWAEQPFIHAAHAVKQVVHDVGHVIGGRPSGCPYQFCGCGASIEIFGKIVPSLNLAANWYRFPRSIPAPDMVAVSPHHVFVLKQHVQGDIWLVKDYNSGGHMTRLHERSISRYTIVDPHV